MSVQSGTPELGQMVTSGTNQPRRASRQSGRDFDAILTGEVRRRYLINTRRTAILFLLLFTTSILAQDKPVNIALSPASTTPPAFLLENFLKAGCANVSIVTDELKADFVLEAHEGDFEGAGGSEGPHGPRPPRPKAHYTLSQGGKIVFGTTPVKETSAVKDVCKYLQKGTK
jgi:hypothetical protein